MHTKHSDLWKVLCISLPALNTAAVFLFHVYRQLFGHFRIIFYFFLKGESDDSILRLAKNDGIVSKYVCLSYPLTLAGVTSIAKSNF